MNNDETIMERPVIDRPYTLRRLKDSDLYPVLDIIGTVLPDELGVVFAQLVTGNKKLEEVGAVVALKIVKAILKNLNTVGDDVYAFLSEVSGIPAEEIPDMEFGTTPAMIWEIVKDAKNTSFFGELSKLL